jgi:hypothetical protein
MIDDLLFKGFGLSAEAIYKNKNCGIVGLNNAAVFLCALIYKAAWLKTSFSMLKTQKISKTMSPRFHSIIAGQMTFVHKNLFKPFLT